VQFEPEQQAMQATTSHVSTPVRCNLNIQPCQRIVELLEVSIPVRCNLNTRRRRKSSRNWNVSIPVRYNLNSWAEKNAIYLTMFQFQ